MTAGTKHYYMYNTAVIASINTNYFYFQYAYVSWTGKVPIIWKNHVAI